MFGTDVYKTALAPMEKLNAFAAEVADSLVNKGTGNAFVDFIAKLVKFIAKINEKILAFFNKIFAKA